MAWTLLDPNQDIFPFEELSWRLLSVPHPEKKDLLNVLRQQHLGVPGVGLLTDEGGLVAFCQPDGLIVTGSGFVDKLWCRGAYGACLP
jgi:hypothetical protein